MGPGGVAQDKKADPQKLPRRFALGGVQEKLDSRRQNPAEPEDSAGTNYIILRLRSE